MPKKYIYSVIIVIAIGLFAAFLAINNHKLGPKFFDSAGALQAESPGASQLGGFVRARVVSVDDESDIENSHLNSYTQTLTMRLLTGDSQGQTLHGIQYETANRRQKLKTGDTVVAAKIPDPRNNNGSPYVIVDQYRLPYIAVIVALFLLLAIVFGRIRGVTALVGLAFSLFMLVYFIAPHILEGQNPVIVSLVGSAIIAIVSIFLAHGFNRRTSLAVVATLVTLGLAQGLAFAAVHYSRLFGNGSEEAYLLQIGTLGAFNLQGILLGSIIIGTLGVLDDVTTGQTVAVAELHLANPKLAFKELYKKAMVIGREHIASLINTLVLAYAGAFFPLFLLIVLSNTQPVWTILNSEFISEEIVRTLVGSIALVLAVPLSTLLAAYYFSGHKDSVAD